MDYRFFLLKIERGGMEEDLKFINYDLLKKPHLIGQCKLQKKIKDF